MTKLKLGIVNSTSIKNAYGGISPFMKNLDPFLTQAFDVTYIVLPDYLNYIRFLPQRLVYAAYLLGKKRKLRKFDAILSHVPEGSYVVSYTKTPFIHIFHGNFNPMSQSRFWYGKYFKAIFEKMERRIIKKATLMYTVGAERQGIPKIINPVYHTVKIKTSELRSGFIFSGRLEKIKNIDKIIRVYSKLNSNIQEKNPLYIAGMGSQESSLKEHARLLPVREKVIFLGNLSNENLVETDSSKRILLMASAQEGFPMAIAEALSLGVPVIATDTGDISRFLISNENGFLLPVSFSDEQYVDSIERILKDYDRFSQNALSSSEVFKAGHVAQGLIDDISKKISIK